MSVKSGEWLDEFGACVACDGEIPHGHRPNCEIHKMQMSIRTMRHALEKIRDGDYRGQNNHSDAHFIAKKALEETE